MQKVSRERAIEIAEGCEEIGKYNQGRRGPCQGSCCKNCGLYADCRDVCDAFLTPIYAGHRKTAGDTSSDAVVKKEGEIFSPAPSQKVINHSPDGFNWSYSGSGPAQLALALLLDVTGDPDVAQQYHQEFKQQVVAGFGDTWQITGDEIKQWFMKEAAEEDATH